MRASSFGIGADAEIAGIARMHRGRTGGRGGTSSRPAARNARRSARRDAQAASDQRLPPSSTIGRSAAQSIFCSCAHVGQARPGLDRLERRRIRHRDALGQHVLGQRDDHRAGAAAGRGVEGARDDLGDARRIVDLGRPFGHGAEHRAVVELLERLALAHVARDLADEQDHRRRILLGDVDAGRGVGGAGPAGDEADAGPAGDLADRLRHHGGAALLPADGDGQIGRS